MQAVCHLVLWEFHVILEKIEIFEKYYGADGIWVKFFQQADGYFGTQLLKNKNYNDRYVTIDHWENEQYYQAFLIKFAAEYAEIDQQCESLTEYEAPLGSFITDHIW